MVKALKTLAASACLSLLALTQAHAGQDQNITVNVSPGNISAHCLFSNAAGKTIADSVPKIVNVMKTTGPTYVSCQSYDGGWRGNAVMKPNVDAWGVIYSIPWIIFRGAADALDDFPEQGGASVTAASAVSYDGKLTIKMERTGPSMESPAEPVHVSYTHLTLPTKRVR